MDFRPGIQLLLGPMFSGKTSEALRRVRRYQHARKRAIIIKYSFDKRYSDEDVVSSHDRVQLPALSTTTLMPLLRQCAEYDVIAVDEGQFFPDVVEFADAAASSGKVVIIAALDGDFRRQPFGRVLELVPLAEEVIKLSAVCAVCCAEAAFTHRTVAESRVELIGGAEAYKPVCRACYSSAVAESAAIEAAAAAALAPAGAASASAAAPVGAASEGEDAAEPAPALAFTPARPTKAVAAEGAKAAAGSCAEDASSAGVASPQPVLASPSPAGKLSGARPLRLPLGEALEGEAEAVPVMAVDLCSQAAEGPAAGGSGGSSDPGSPAASRSSPVLAM